MSNFIKNLPVYRPDGQPAYAWVQIPTMVLAGDNVTINGDVYTFGVDFFGQSAAQALRSLVNAVRANQNDASEVAPTNTSFFRSYCSEFSGKYCVLFATSPGTAGNAFTLATSAPSRLVISGANFVGGLAGTSLPVTSTTVPSGSALTDASGTITSGGVAQLLMAANASRKYLLVQNQSNDPLWINFDGTDAVAGQPSLQIPANGGSYERAAGFVPTGAISIIGATTGDAFTTKQA